MISSALFTHHSLVCLAGFCGFLLFVFWKASCSLWEEETEDVGGRESDRPTISVAVLLLTLDTFCRGNLRQVPYLELHQVVP